jgi:D-alanyl-D-alanine carboxypeptidase
MAFRRWVACAAAASAIVAVPTAAMAAPPHPTGEDRHTLRQDLDAVVANGPTGALVEVVDGARVTRATSGSALAGTIRPIDPRGRFRAGSITKAFVATVVLQLVADPAYGLRLDDPVDAWLPGLLPDGNLPDDQKITVRELLNHTSGLFDYTDTLPLNPPTDFLPLRWRTWTLPELIDRGTAQAPVFSPPGSAYHYSSTDYLVLGELIERVTGNSAEDEVSARILRPLKLRDTTMPGTDPRIPGPHAHAYIPDGNGGVVDITEFNPSVESVAGEVISTADDLNTFTAALLGGRLLPPEQLRDMMTVSAPSETGLGLEVIPLSCGKTAYGHDGDSLGASAWTFTTGDGHAVTLSVTWGTNRLAKTAVSTLLDDALCTL